MKTAALGLVLALAAAAPSRAPAEEVLPPPPPPPGDEAAPPRTPAPADPGPRDAGSLAPTPPRVASSPAVIGEAPVAPAGSMGAPLRPDEKVYAWKFSLASGVIGRFGGYQLHTDQENAGLLLYFGGQADGQWTEGYGRAARLRLRLMTGGERIVFIPSDGEVEAAWMLGRPELRFVVGRVEVARYTGLAIQTLAQVATLPSFEGSLTLGGDRVRLFYSISPVEMAWVSYFGRAHIDHTAAWTTETDHPDAASSFRARVTFVVPPAVLLSLQGDFLKFWGSADMLTTAEASIGMAVLDKSVLISVLARWEAFRRRDHVPATSITADQFLGMASATLVF
jgi:hypothetical protein